MFAQRVDVPEGTRFGKLTVVREAKPYVRPTGQVIRRALVRCECGVEYVARLYNVRKYEREQACRDCGGRSRAA